MPVTISRTTKNAPPPVTPDTWLTVSDVGRVLQCHDSTVRRWIRESKLVAKKIGGGVRIRSSDLDAFINAENA
ncbi:MAG: helix-turn-helix domain-containing protein [Alphaproteobacteria bacterium]|nr:helix-turn-helix domain-containing protein [Alphaproteobacteria bacterium]